MEKLIVKMAANITYSGFERNTVLHIEYKHTGIFYSYLDKKGIEHIAHSKHDAMEWKAKGKKVTEKPGYWYMGRIAIPIVRNDGESDIWYINNDGDNYTVNKVSKYGRKVHAQLSNNIIPESIKP